MPLTALEKLNVIAMISPVIPTIETDIVGIDVYRIVDDFVLRLSVNSLDDIKVAVEIDPAAVRRHFALALSTARATPSVIDIDHNGIDDRIDMVNVRGQMRVRLAIVAAVAILLLATIIAAVVVPDDANVSAVLTTVATSLTSVLIMVVGGIQPIMRANRSTTDGNTSS